MICSWYDCISYIIRTNSLNLNIKFPCQMKITNTNVDSLNAIRQKELQNKTVNPRVHIAMKNYAILQIQLYRHFFDGDKLNISNKSFSQAYTDLYNLLNDSSFVIQNGKDKFQSIQQSFLQIYKHDLKQCAGKIYEQLQKLKGLQPEEQIAYIAGWLNVYARFNHWIFKMFMIIERNAMMAQGVKLYFEGIKVLKEHIFDKIYDDLYRVVFQALELYKNDKLRAFDPLKIVIRYIGIVGFSKYKLVEMVKTRDDRFEYNSKRDNNQTSQIPFETPYFKANFIARLVRDLKQKYNQIVIGMMQLSTPEYFQQARNYIEKEQATADHFYGHSSVKETVIRYILETLIVQRAEGLLQNPKSGLLQMMKERDIKNMAKIYQLLKKSNMQRVFFKEFQSYITSEGERIVSRMTPEEQKIMKKQTIQIIIKEIIEFNQLVDNLRSEIDIHDAQLQKAQNMGFQAFCNSGNKICNYLAYYSDLMLKKDDKGNSGDIVQQVGKISKYLYSYDYYMNMHQKLLGLRIIYENFKNEEAEFALINMLKNEAGINATSKISNMIQDQKSSQLWNSEFNLKNQFGFGMDVMMLTSGSWEVNDPKCGKNFVPPELMPAVTAFEDKFLQKMPNRSVSWIFTHGRAIVQFIPNSKVKYILILNNYQLLTLLHLKRNQYSSVKYGDLLSQLKIEDEPFFKSSLMSLLKNGLLVKQGGTVRIESKNQELQLNFDFKYKTTKVGCIIIPKYTEKTATSSIPVSAERCILIDAALVKIMKQRRRCPYQQLIVEVQKMCRTFKAEVQQIKLRIENCQQRQFIQRDGNDMNMLIYRP